MSAQASIEVRTTPDVVFDILADPRQHHLIDGSGTVTGHVSGPDRLSLGAEFAMDMKQGASYKVKNKVVEFEENRLIAWRHVSPHRWRYELEPTTVEGEPGTRVTETWDLSPVPAPVRWGLNTLLGKRTQHGIEETLVKLRDAAERR